HDPEHFESDEIRAVFQNIPALSWVNCPRGGKKQQTKTDHIGVHDNSSKPSATLIIERSMKPSKLKAKTSKTQHWI
ncbi:hypothetical protein NPIL_48831, partial [Nephila pilipes]